MGMDTKLKDGTDYLPKYNWTTGMNDDLARADAAGYNTSIEMVTSGVPLDWGDLGGLEVGPSNYEMDPMGEERTKMTFPADGALGMIGMAATEAAPQQGTQALVGGKRADMSSPQTYNSIGLKKNE